MILDPAALGPMQSYKFITGAVVPRPIAFVSSRGSDGSVNLAPFSFFTGVCGNPPCVLFCPMRRGPAAERKDTLRNIEETKEFVVNIVTEEIAERMNVTSGEYPYGIDEFEVAGFTKAPSVIVAPPRVAESPISLECRLFQVVHVSDQPYGGSVVIGEVLRMHVRDDLYDAAHVHVDVSAMKPVARLAGNWYTTLGRLFEMSRPQVPKP